MAFVPYLLDMFLGVVLAFKIHKKKRREERTKRTEAILVVGAAFLNASYTTATSCSDDAAMFELGARVTIMHITICREHDQTFQVT